MTPDKRPPRKWSSIEIFKAVNSGDDLGLPENFVSVITYQAALDEIKALRHEMRMQTSAVIERDEAIQQAENAAIKSEEEYRKLEHLHQLAIQRATSAEAIQTLKYRNEAITELRATIAKERERAERAEKKLKAKELNGTLRGYDGMAEELDVAIERAERAEAFNDQEHYRRYQGSIKQRIRLSEQLTAEREKSQTLVEALEEVGDNLGDSERRDIPIIRKIISAALAEFEGEG